MKRESFGIRGGVCEIHFLRRPDGKLPGRILLNNGGQAPSRRTCCFLAAAIRLRETQHLEGEGQWVAVGPARAIHRGTPRDVDTGFYVDGAALPVIRVSMRCFQEAKTT